MIFGLLYFCVVILCVNRSRSSFILDRADKSLFNMVRFILHTYNLPSIFSCLKDNCQNQNGRET